VKALQYQAVGEEPELTDVPLPEPGPGQVRIKVTAAGACHSDIFVMSLPKEQLAQFGYPLPMTVVLPALTRTAPSAVLADLHAGGTSADPAGQIIRAIEYSHGKLDPALQTALLLLAPFTNVINTGPALDIYQNLLMQDATVQVMEPDNLAAAVAEAVRVGLAAPHPQISDMVQVLPVLPYFLRARLHQHDDLRQAIAQAHYELYSALGSELRKLLVSYGDPQALEIGRAMKII